MGDADDLSLVQSILETVGLRVERVPEANVKRCDLRVYGPHERYLVEVKGSYDDPAIARSLREGKLVENSKSFSISNVEDAIRTAVKQLGETLDQQSPELRVVVLISRNQHDIDLVAQQVLGVLYGKRSLIGQDAAGASVHHECLYFAESAFFRHRNGLDAVVAIDPNGVALCANDHCANVARVRESELGRFFKEKGAFYDVGVWEQQGRLIADCAF